MESPKIPPESEVFVALQRAAGRLSEGLDAVLKPAGLSATAYNLLRILRGAGPEGLTCGQVAERMIARDPDITRLLDRLEKRGLVARERSRKDRRIVTTRITAAGRDLLGKLDQPISLLHRQQLSRLDAEALAALAELLERLAGSSGS